MIRHRLDHWHSPGASPLPTTLPIETGVSSYPNCMVTLIYNAETSAAISAAISSTQRESSSTTDPGFEPDTERLDE